MSLYNENVAKGLKGGGSFPCIAYKVMKNIALQSLVVLRLESNNGILPGWEEA